MAARRYTLVLLLTAMAGAAMPAVAAELQERTKQAYDTFFSKVRSAFLGRSTGPAAVLPAGSELRVGPGTGDGILEVPGGLVHHWSGAMLVRGLTLTHAIEESQNYAAYPSVYSPVVSAQLLARDGNRFRIHMRIKGGGGGVSAVLDMTSTVEFTTLEHRAYSISTADEIREVTGSGDGERLLPAGRDSGYLWRAATLTMFTEVTDGVIIEMETIGLSRRFPPMLGWLIEPIARRLGRRSVETSLKEFAAAATRQPRPDSILDRAHDRLDVRAGAVEVRERRIALVEQ